MQRNYCQLHKSSLSHYPELNWEGFYWEWRSSLRFDVRDLRPSLSTVKFILTSTNLHPRSDSIVEASIGVICSSVPHLPALFHRLAPTLSHINHWIYGLLCSWKTKLQTNSELPRHDRSGFNLEATAPPRMQVNSKVLGSIQGYVKDLLRLTSFPRRPHPNRRKLLI